MFSNGSKMTVFKKGICGLEIEAKLESWQGTLHKFNHKNVLITCRSQHSENREEGKDFTWIKGCGKMPWWTAGHMPSRGDRQSELVIGNRQIRGGRAEAAGWGPALS